ncbi:STELLO glycosyltransferase family protein [Microcoleus sp. T3_B1]|uniref:STELLO glycosyltransferase family protein n=1 Tax=Microcoleus sp. T3_B1 TaxID=3055425 RepID=UPI002FD7772B
MNFLVITTIQSPTPALFKYRDLLLELGWRIVVVGDQKSPPTFDLPGVDYLNLEKQQELFGELASLVPLNHYARKNLGYLYAIQKGAEAIAESDDDNIPYDDKYPNFLPPQINTSVLEVKDTVNVYSYFTEKKIWPRGIPLDKVGNLVSEEQIVKKEVTCYLQQGLADLDPDVDAIYRLTTAQGDVIFDSDKKLALGSGCYSPFNTQNTLFYKEAFPLMLLPISVHSRVTDIWRSYIAQKLLWCMDSSVLFLSPSVYQQRNEHNLLKDFKDEIPLYTQVNDLINLLETFNSDTISPGGLMSELYSFLRQHNFLGDLDVRLCDLWIKAISSSL